MLPDTSQSFFGRQLLKRFLYSQMGLLDAVKILLGRTQPRVQFTIKSDPALVYFNFRVKVDEREDFIRYINLPDGFSVCPIRCLQGEEPDVLLTLNVYEVTGVAAGIRAEWSTYVLDYLGKPRYMVVEAQSSTYSMDPTDIITRKGRVEHSTSGAETVTGVASLEGGLFESRFPVPTDAPEADIHPEWVAANDYIYWRVGICDRVFYDAGMANPKARLIDPQAATIRDSTHWAKFLEPTPKHIIQFEEGVELVVMPWANI
jgi:hypothetical protein